MKNKILCVILLLSSALLYPSCISIVGNVLTGEGSSTVFTGDSDPELIKDALPFAIKIYEALLDAAPKHQGLLLTTGSLFVMYANAFVQGPVEMLPADNWEERDAGLKRAKQMYLRGSNMIYTALDTKYRGFIKAAAQESTFQPYLKKMKKGDVGLLYWAVAGGMAAFSLDVLDFNLSLRIPEWKAMIERAYELNPDFNGATLDEFLLIFYASLPEIMGGDKKRAEFHFQRALEKTGGNSAGAYVAYAQAVCVPAQNYEKFKDCLENALAINPDEDISTRLVTIITQRKARWLLDNAWTVFSFLPMPDDY